MPNLSDSPLVQVTTELVLLRQRVKSLEAQEPVSSLLATGGTAGATSQSQAFTLGVVAPWIDYPLIDTTNGSHLNDNTNTFPAGWTQADSPQATASNDVYGFWSIVGASGNNSWKYQRQTPFDIEALAVNAHKSFHVGPLLIKESLPTADLNYYFGIYRNNAGAVDENTFMRINVNWSSASSIWQARAERKDGATQTNGTYYPLARAPVGPLWMRITLKNATNKEVFGYIGSVPFHLLNMQIMNSNVGSGVTWGQVWWQFHMSRGAGPDDRIMIGGYDYSNNT